MTRWLTTFGAVVAFVFFVGCESSDDSPSDGIITDLDELARLFCEQEKECYPEWFYDDYETVQDCIDAGYAREEIGSVVEHYEEHGTAACHQSSLEYFNCLVQLSCSELYEWAEGVGSDYPCWEEGDTMNRLCD